MQNGSLFASFRFEAKKKYKRKSNTLSLNWFMTVSCPAVMHDGNQPELIHNNLLRWTDSWWSAAQNWIMVVICLNYALRLATWSDVQSSMHELSHDSQLPWIDAWWSAAWTDAWWSAGLDMIVSSLNWFKNGQLPMWLHYVQLLWLNHYGYLPSSINAL